MEIRPSKIYTIQEILDASIIPGVTGYTGLYNLLTVKEKDKDNKLKVKRVLAPETTARTIKSTHMGHPWSKISGKIGVQGIEIIKFLKINGMI